MRCYYWPIFNLSWRIKESKILFCQNRVENLSLIIFWLSPMKNTQIWRFWTIFSEMVDFCIGPFLTPYLSPIWPRKIFSKTIFFLVFNVDFEKRNRFAAFSHPKMALWGFFAKRLINLKNFQYFFKYAQVFYKCKSNKISKLWRKIQLYISYIYFN